MNPVGGGGSGNSASVQAIIAMREELLQRSKVLQELQQSNAPQTQGIGPADHGGGGFADALQGALRSVNSSQQESARISEAYERGEVSDIAQVMLARQEASIGFEATLQVRNKLLSAYQDIMRMGV